MRNEKPSPEAKIEWLVKKNPKREGSKAHARAKSYWQSKTVADYFAAGGTPADLVYDASKSFLQVESDAE